MGGIPGSRVGSAVNMDPATFAAVQNAAIANLLARVVTQEQLAEAVAEAVAEFATSNLARDDLSNVNAQTGRVALGLGSSATRSVGQLASEDAFRNTYARPAGDLAGTAEAPTVARIRGVTVSGTPQAGYVLMATSATTAAWTAPSAIPDQAVRSSARTSRCPS